MRRFAMLAVIVVLGPSPTAWAQHHHGGHMSMSTGEAEPAIHVMVGVSAEAGEVEAFASQVSYQGVAVMASGSRGDWEAMAHVPFYRIDLGGRNGTGLGDIHVEGRWMGLRSDGVQAGLAIGAMPPFGDDADGLAMGHWMVMTAAIARWGRGRLSTEGRFGYNGALSSAGHAEHGVPVWPPVAPMNAQELAMSGTASVALGHKVSVSLRLATAAPLGLGEFTALAAGGAGYRIGNVMLGVGVRRGFWGHTAGLVADGHAMASF